MNLPYKIQILLSTYNGEKFLAEQLDSMLEQDYPEFTILIRDDGSSDKTCDILSDYQSKHSNINVIFADNMGVTRSYYEWVRLAIESIFHVCITLIVRLISVLVMIVHVTITLQKHRFV